MDGEELERRRQGCAIGVRVKRRVPLGAPDLSSFFGEGRQAADDLALRIADHHHPAPPPWLL